MKKILLPVILVSLGIPVLSSAQFTNGSFESPAISSGSVTQESTIPGWTTSTATYLVSNNVPPGTDAVSWWNTTDGSQYLYLNGSEAGGVTLSQSINVAAGNQTLDFMLADFATQFISPGGQVDVSINRTSDNSVVVSSTNFTTPDYSQFLNESLDFTAPTTDNYTFTFTSVANHATLLDGIKLQAVPEPKELLPLGLGLIFLLVRRKR